VLKFSAFLFVALIFFVSFFYQEKKENEGYPFQQKFVNVISNQLKKNYQCQLLMKMK